MQITLIRHLPTDWNKKNWLQGRRDIGLSRVTEEIRSEIIQNELVLEKLSPFDIILASTLKRTQQTAHIYGFQPETENLLDELDFGPFEGLPKEKLMKKYRKRWIENPKGLVLGESIKTLENRIITFLDKYKDFNNLLVFGHGAWIRAIISYSQHGHINNMNKMMVGNNACITLRVDTERNGTGGTALV